MAENLTFQLPIHTWPYALSKIYNKVKLHEFLWLLDQPFRTSIKCEITHFLPLTIPDNLKPFLNYDNSDLLICSPSKNLCKSQAHIAILFIMFIFLFFFIIGPLLHKFHVFLALLFKDSPDPPLPSSNLNEKTRFHKKLYSNCYSCFSILNKMAGPLPHS